MHCSRPMFMCTVCFVDVSAWLLLAFQLVLGLVVAGCPAGFYQIFNWAYVLLRLQQIHCFWGAIKVNVGLVAVEMLGSVDFG
ncbi:unnamed protein product [Ilex paraguariensis]|uniref:Uncharacterized protein n=1 Tax=Ilex paraguariensis TaxID=185542 RepID=A0ABC8SME1_9AQUA